MTQAAFVLAMVATAPGAVYGESAVPADYWRNPRRCGVNCLYAYLSLHGRPVRLDSLVERVPIGDKGSNMADLRRAASELGIPSQVVRTTPGRLAEFPLPAIAHLQSRDGHFVLVLQVTPEVVTMADMLDGNVENLPADAFFELWSGYLLTPHSVSRTWLWALLGAGTTAAVGLFLYRPRQPDRAERGGA